MMFFITFLRAIAACIITNAHYTGVYPTDLIANGGLLGDVLFFSVSGFCLTNLKYSFPKWYLRRIVRIFPAVWLITAVYALMGFYRFEGLSGFISLFLYPTSYHFVASIIVLYIPFYFVMKTDKLRNNIPAVFGAIAVIQLLVYIIFYDKTIYHIDTVREPMIRFLFFEAMLIGAYMKLNCEKFINKNRVFYWVCSLVLFVFYFGSKISFSKIEPIAKYQIVNQYILIILLIVLFRAVAGIDSLLSGLNKNIKAVITFLSDRTLEIYLVQYVIIPNIARMIPVFPINWLVITAAIILSATGLHIVSSKIKNLCEKTLFLEKEKIHYEK